MTRFTQSLLRPLHRIPERSTQLAVLLIASTLCLFSTGQPAAQEPTWDSLSEGLAASRWQPPSLCQVVPPLLMVRIDPERFRFSIYHYADEGLPHPLTIQEWQDRTKSLFLFNAGLFQQDYSYLGLLIKGGRLLNSKRHSTWQGLFVAEPASPRLPKARIFDLAFESFREENPLYREAAQSLMLLDRTGKPRVRQTGKRAFQTLVAEDERGHIVVIKSTEVVALYDIAQCFHDHLPSIRQAMAMDGGSSSDLLIDAEMLSTVAENQATSWHHILRGGGSSHIPLPAVIGVTPRTHTTGNQSMTAGGRRRP